MGADPAAPAGAVVECEVASGVAPVAAPTAVVPALVLVRVFSEPIGMLALKLPADGLAPPELARAIVNELEPGVARALRGLRAELDR